MTANVIGMRTSGAMYSVATTIADTGDSDERPELGRLPVGTGRRLERPELRSPISFHHGRSPCAAALVRSSLGCLARAPPEPGYQERPP